MSDLSAYELKRLQNIAGNNAKLAALGLEEAASAMRTQAKGGRKRQRVPAEPKAKPPPPTRSSRSRGPAPELHDVPAELDDRAIEDQDGDGLSSGPEKLKRSSDKPRLTAEQQAKLNTLEPVSSAPLTETDIAPIGMADADLKANRTPGGWQAHKSKGTSMYGEKRAILQDAARRHGLRWPEWLGKIEAALPPMGTKQDARDQTMYTIERAACGLGLTYKHWPEGVGVLLAGKEDASPPPLPRLLTLGSDTEVLKREGQRLEYKFGRDAGNGCARPAPRTRHLSALS